MLIAADAARAIKTVNVSVKCFQVLCKSNEDVDDDDVVEAQANHHPGKKTPFGRFIMSSRQCEWNVGINVQANFAVFAECAALGKFLQGIC